MMRISATAIYVLWLREMKRLIRAKSRIAGMVSTPLFFLVFMGLGFSKMRVPMLEGVSYVDFLVPGIIGMGLLFTCTLGGFSVLWDRQFGFLKEIMVTPVSRLSIMLGRTAGGVSTALVQGIVLLALSPLMGFRIPSVLSVLIAIGFMVLIATTFIGLGLVFASKMKDMHGFSMIMNFVMFPLLFLSGALFPIQNLPGPLVWVCYLNPLTYGVDGLRAALIGASLFSPPLDLTFSLGCALAMMVLGAHLFERSEGA